MDYCIANLWLLTLANLGVSDRDFQAFTSYVLCVVFCVLPQLALATVQFSLFSSNWHCTECDALIVFRLTA